MKEREGQGQDLSQNELTRQADSSNLESGDIFMPDGQDKGPEQPPKDVAPGESGSDEGLDEKQIESLRRIVADPNVNVDLRRAAASKLGEGGGSEDEPEEESTPEFQRSDKDFAPRLRATNIKTFGDPIAEEQNELTPDQRQFAQQYIEALSPELLAGGFSQNDIAHAAAVAARNPRTMEAYAMAERSRREKARIKDRSGRQEVVDRVQQEIKADVGVIRASEDLQSPVAKGALDAFVERARDTLELAKQRQDETKYKEYADKIAKLEALRASGDLTGIKSELSDDFVKDVRSYYEQAEEVVPDIPESLEDLAALVMKREGGEWKTGGKRELVDSEGKVVKENFMAWVRKKMIDIHDFNPTTTVDFFSGIIVKSRWSQVSLYEMVLTGSYFLEKKKEKVIAGKNADGTIAYKEQVTVQKNDDYEKLRHQLLMEAFLFQTSRNAHVEYVVVQADELELSKLLSKLYSTNVFTRGDNLEFMFSMPSMNKAKTTDDEKANFRKGKEIQTKLEHNFEVGQAMRKLLMAYYYIYDYEALRNILGEDSALFQEYYRNIDADTGMDAVDIDGKKKDRKKSEGRKSDSEAYDVAKWYKNGRVSLGNAKDKADFIEYVNVFTGPGPNKDANIIAEVRERMVQSIMDKMGLDYTEAKYAEAWAFSMTRWTGLAGKNDTHAVGHDAWAKVQNTQEYRFRQMAEERNALFGNIFNILGIKRIGVNWFEGIRDTHGRTIIEAIQGGQGGEMDLNTPIKSRDKQGKGKPISFNDDAMRLFAANHIINTFFLEEFLIDHNGFNFQDMLTIDTLGRPVIDYEKANKVIGGVDKAIRYAYSTWSGLDYSRKVRTWERVEDEYEDEYHVKNKVSTARPKDLPILAELFGPEILTMLKKEVGRQVIIKAEKERAYVAKMSSADRLRYEAAKVKKGKKKDVIWDMGGEVGELNLSEIQERAVRRLLWKSVFKYYVQAEIESHRNVFSDQERFNMQKMEAIYDFLKIKHILTEEDIHKIRQETHSTVFGMMFEEAGGSLLAGLRKAMEQVAANSQLLVS